MKRRSDTQEGIGVWTQLHVEPSILRLVIPFTTPELTAAALRHVVGCTDLDVDIHVIDVEVVPFPCPLDQPPVNKEFAERRLQQLMEDTGLECHAQVVYTRDRFEGFCRALERKSVVVLATKKRWWPTRESTLGRFLTRGGHQVMLLPVR